MISVFEFVDLVFASRLIRLRRIRSKKKTEIVAVAYSDLPPKADNTQ